MNTSVVNNMQNIGDDPRLLDDFYQLKEEVDKISDIDYKKIKALAEHILASVAKDLRVAAYLIFAEIYLDGLTGFVRALIQFNELVQTYGEACHPQKINAKLALFKWMAENRMNQAILAKLDTASSDVQASCVEQIAMANQLIKTLSADAPLLFSKLSNQLKLSEESRKRAKEHESIVNVMPIQHLSAANDTPALPSIDCHNEQDAKELLYKLLDYFRRDNQWLRAVSLVRDFRWGNVIFPVHEDYHTAVPAPDESIVIQLEAAIINKKPIDLLAWCDQTFLENGGLYYLDLQYHAAHAAQASNLPLVKAAIEHALKVLLERFPDLLNCRFANGMPFINPAYRGWLEALMSPSVGNPVVTIHSSTDLEAIINQLRGKVAGKSLAEKMNILNPRLASDGKEAFEWELGLAKFAFENKRHDIALALLEKLDMKIEQQTLFNWQPEYALYTWQFLYQVLRLRSNKLAGQMQKELEDKCEKLFFRICQLKPDVAMQLAH